MTEEIVVIGAGGFGRETLDVIEAINAEAEDPRWQVLGIADDRPSELHLARLTSAGYLHLGSVSQVLTDRRPGAYVIGIGNPEARNRVATAFEVSGWEAATLVHPRAVVSRTAELGAGSVICGGVQLSTNTSLGKHVHLNPNATIGHDSRLGDYVSVNPAATVSGEVTIEARALVGAAAVILQGLYIGSGALIGASACVTRDVDASSTVYGVPARTPRGSSRANEDGEG